jgi:hypothetical protein
LNARAGRIAAESRRSDFQLSHNVGTAPMVGKVNTRRAHSMIDAGITTVISVIRETSTADNGDIVSFWSKTPTLKRYRRNGNAIAL